LNAEGRSGIKHLASEVLTRQASDDALKPTGSPSTTQAAIEARRDDDGGARLILRGPLTMASLQRAWRPAIEAVAALGATTRLVVDVAGVERADGAGAALIVDLRRRAAAQGAQFVLEGTSDSLRGLLDLYEPEAFLQDPPPPPRLSLTVKIGIAFWDVLKDIRDQIAFVGELCAALVHVARHPRSLRWRETLVVAERAGVDALPIVVLLGFLIGLIMAFQAAIPMKQFGIELYVADLISLSMVRELGALITAIILAGRTGSAFAAELGTMKINEEINALQTLGLDPVRFLVVGRVLVGIVMTPLLTLFAIAAGLGGGLVVLLSMDFTAAAYFKEARWILSLSYFLGGMAKSVVFGFLVAGIGCLRGLQTRSGASAVGQAATRAVVSIIVAIVVVDGLFAVVYYYLKI
jgi:phospholipid/cholesterol/gamma-HCH transport system permease protein